MGFRFRRSIRILPGVRININKGSTSISVGGRGFHKTYSSTGRVTTSIGIPGTGLSYTTSSNPNRTVARNNNDVTRSAYNSSAYERSTNVQQESVVNINSLREEIMDIYRDRMQPINWKQVLFAPDGTYPDYLKSRVENVLNGDIDTYFEILADINPFDKLIQYGSNFEVGTDDPRMMSVHFHVNSKSVLGSASSLSREQYNDLVQDYVCGCAIRLARDVFALLPVRHVEIVAKDGNNEILIVDFPKMEFEDLDFSSIDASDSVEKFEHKMNFTIERGFQAI